MPISIPKISHPLFQVINDLAFQAKVPIFGTSLSADSLDKVERNLRFNALWRVSSHQETKVSVESLESLSPEFQRVIVDRILGDWFDISLNDFLKAYEKFHPDCHVSELIVNLDDNELSIKAVVSEGGSIVGYCDHLFSKEMLNGNRTVICCNRITNNNQHVQSEFSRNHRGVFKAFVMRSVEFYRSLGCSSYELIASLDGLIAWASIPGFDFVNYESSHLQAAIRKSLDEISLALGDAAPEINWDELSRQKWTPNQLYLLRLSLTDGRVIERLQSKFPYIKEAKIDPYAFGQIILSMMAYYHIRLDLSERSRGYNEFLDYSSAWRRKKFGITTLDDHVNFLRLPPLTIDLPEALGVMMEKQFERGRTMSVSVAVVDAADQLVLAEEQNAKGHYRVLSGGIEVSDAGAIKAARRELNEELGFYTKEIHAIARQPMTLTSKGRVIGNWENFLCVARLPQVVDAHGWHPRKNNKEIRSIKTVSADEIDSISFSKLATLSAIDEPMKKALKNSYRLKKIGGTPLTSTHSLVTALLVAGSMGRTKISTAAPERKLISRMSSQFNLRSSLLRRK